MSANLDGALGRAKRRERVARTLAERLTSAVACRPLLAPRTSSGVYPRLFVLCPDAIRRDAALAALERIQAGVTGMYPTSLDQLPALRPALCDATSHPEAQRLAGRLLTLPVHGGLRGLRLRAVESILGETLGRQVSETTDVWAKAGQTATSV